jgi:hypothetical protein
MSAACRRLGNGDRILGHARKARVSEEAAAEAATV